MPSHPQSITNCCTAARIRRCHTAVLGSPFIPHAAHKKSTARTDWSNAYLHYFFSSCGGLGFLCMDSPRISMGWA